MRNPIVVARSHCDRGNPENEIKKYKNILRRDYIKPGSILRQGYEGHVATHSPARHSFSNSWATTIREITSYFKVLCFLMILYCPVFALSEANIIEKPIVVLITSYNNSEWCDWNLSSVFTQTYTNYRIIYIDDCSTDDTYELVLEKIKQNKFTDRIQLIHNTQRKGVLANVYTATHTCADEEIVVILDGDDAFAHSEVLTRINKAYQNNNVWMTYGQYKESVTQKIGKCAPIPITFIQRNAYREYPWVTSHARTYYAWLFKHIDKESFTHNHTFFTVATDLAAMFPMLEMAGGRFEFINEVLYEYNTSNRLNNFKVRRKQQLECEQIIRHLPRYQPLLPIINNKK